MSTTQTAAEAYYYFYPLVENLHQVRRYVAEGIGANHAAPFNSFSHGRTLAGPDDTFVTINNDTLYSMAQLDLSVGPVRLSVPAIDRYYVLQFVDAWTNNIAYIGTRATGSEAGEYLIVPPGFDGEVPEGVTVVQSSTDVLSIVGRFACASPDDVAPIHAIQDATVLSPVDPTAVGRGIPEAAADVPAELLFWEEARLFSQAFPAPAEEAAFAAPFAVVGVQDAESPYAALDAAVRQELVDGLTLGEKNLEEFTLKTDVLSNNGWGMGVHLFDYNSYALGLGTIDEPRWRIEDETYRIMERATACRLGLWGNHAYEAVYAQAFTTVDGQPLTGASTYTIRFDELPPVDAFWSITLYDIPRYYLVDNPIDRYSIGDRTAGIRYDADGGFTVTVSQSEPADEVQRANWLPAPADRFRLVLRLYIPQERILDNSFPLPKVVAN